MLPRIFYPLLKLGILLVIAVCLSIAILTVSGIFVLNFLLVTTNSYTQFVTWLSGAQALKTLLLDYHRVQLEAKIHRSCHNAPKIYERWNEQHCPSYLIEKRLHNIYHIISRTHQPSTYNRNVNLGCKNTLSLLDTIKRRLINLIDNNGKLLNDQKSSESAQLSGSSSDESGILDNHKLSGCREVYHGSSKGYPYFKTGFQIVDCPYIEEIHKQLTILYIVDHNISNAGFIKLNHMASDILYPGNKGKLNHLIFKVPNSHYSLHLFKSPNPDKVYNITTQNGKYNGQTNLLWAQVLAQIQTPFVLFSLNEILLKATPNISRLLFEAYKLGFDLLGGAVKMKNNSWFLNCYQMHLSDYRLRFQTGYSQSSRECIACDYFDGPVLIRVSSLTNMLNNASHLLPLFGPSFFEDLFIHIKTAKYKAGVCPDIMFQLNHNSILDRLQKSGPKPAPWLESLMLKWDLYEIVNHAGASIKLSCQTDQNDQHLNKLCHRQDADRIIHPCCRFKFHAMLRFVMHICQRLEIPCEIQEGTLLGAVKLGTTLPWDRDGDVAFLSSAFARLVDAHGKFTDAGYQLLQASKPTCCVDNAIAGGKFIVQSSGMHIEMFGQHIMRESSSIDLKRNSSENTLNYSSSQLITEPTQILIAGHWVAGPENPGLHVRNRYGRNLYKHSPHWMSAEMLNGWQAYKTFYFAQCRSQWHHSCLDKIKTDGNIEVLG